MLELTNLSLIGISNYAQFLFGQVVTQEQFYLNMTNCFGTSSFSNSTPGSAGLKRSREEFWDAEPVPPRLGADEVRLPKVYNDEDVKAQYAQRFVTYADDITTYVVEQG